MYQMHVDYPLCRDKDGDQGRVWFPTELCHAMCGDATLGDGRIERHNHGGNITCKSCSCLTLISNQTAV